MPCAGCACLAPRLPQWSVSQVRARIWWRDTLALPRKADASSKFRCYPQRRSRVGISGGSFPAVIRRRGQGWATRMTLSSQIFPASRYVTAVSAPLGIGRAPSTPESPPLGPSCLPRSPCKHGPSLSIRRGRWRSLPCWFGVEVCRLHIVGSGWLVAVRVQEPARQVEPRESLGRVGRLCVDALRELLRALAVGGEAALRWSARIWRERAREAIGRLPASGRAVGGNDRDGRAPAREPAGRVRRAGVGA